MLASPPVSGVSPSARRSRLTRTAQQRAGARHQLADAERLGQVIVGAALEADDLVGLVATRGQHQNRHVVIEAAVPDRAAQRQAVEAGNHHVEHHQVVALALAALQRRGAVGEAFALVPFVP